MPIPIVLDTDIGTDIDDAYALILAAVSPELDLRAVTLVNNDVGLRGRIARRILYLLGNGAHVVHGASFALDGTRPPGWMGHEGKGIQLGIPAEGAYDPASVEIADQILVQGCETIVAIGQVTNIAEAIRKIPHSIRSGINIVAMASSFEGIGPDVAVLEHNLRCDPLAMQELLASGARVRLIGLNVTRQTSMSRGDLRRLQRFKTPLALDLVGMHQVWFEAIRRDHSPMHDPLAVVAVFRPDLFEFEPMRAVIDLEKGVAAFYDDGEANCEVAVDVDADAFHQLFFDRIIASLV